MVHDLFKTQQMNHAVFLSFGLSLAADKLLQIIIGLDFDGEALFNIAGTKATPFPNICMVSITRKWFCLAVRVSYTLMCSLPL